MLLVYRGQEGSDLCLDIALASGALEAPSEELLLAVERSGAPGGGAARGALASRKKKSTGKYFLGTKKKIRFSVWS